MRATIIYVHNAEFSPGSIAIGIQTYILWLSN